MVEKWIRGWRRRTLSLTAQERVEARLATFERATGAELVIAIHRSSRPYPAATFRFALIFSAALTASCMAMGFSHPLLPIIATLLGVLLGGMRPFNEMSWTAIEMERNTRQAAIHAFHTYGIRETSHRAGSLLYLSLVEQRVHFLVDRELSPKLPERELQSLVDQMSGPFKARQFEKGLLETIEVLERKFLEAFPSGVAKESRAGDGELRNKIRWS